MKTIGFDNDKYIAMQSQNIRDRIEYFGGKLYLEFGGKLFDDFHASRVLPGFAPDIKLKMLLNMKERVEVVIVISAEDIENKKIRGDIGISYDADVLRLIDAFLDSGLYVGSIVIGMYNGQRSADVRTEHYDRGEDCSLSAVGEHLMYKRKHHYCCREVVKVCAYDECQNGYRP